MDGTGFLQTLFGKPVCIFPYCLDLIMKWAPAYYALSSHPWTPSVLANTFSKASLQYKGNTNFVAETVLRDLGWQRIGSTS